MDSTKRNRAIVAMAKTGMTYEEIGSTFGVTRERVRQILNKAGITGSTTRGARAVAKREALAARPRAILEWAKQNPGLGRPRCRDRAEPQGGPRLRSARSRSEPWSSFGRSPNVDACATATRSSSNRRAMPRSSGLADEQGCVRRVHGEVGGPRVGSCQRFGLGRCVRTSRGGVRRSERRAGGQALRHVEEGLPGRGARA